MTRSQLMAAAAVAAVLSCPGLAAGQAAPPVPPAPAAAAVDASLGVRTGTPSAARQLTLFCDLQEPACAQAVIVLRHVLRERPNDLGITFRHLAPEAHRDSAVAYRAALAAALQGRGWGLLDMACANPDRLDAAGLHSMAVQLELDVNRFLADAASAVVSDVLDEDVAEAKRLKVEQVPALFLDGKRLPDVFTYEAILSALK